MVEYSDYNIEAQERVLLIDLIHEIDRDISNLVSIDKHPTINKIVNKIGGLRRQKERIEVSIADHSSQYKIDQIKRIDDEINLLIDILEFVNDQDKTIQTKTYSYRKGITAFVRGSELLQTIAFIQEANTEAHKEIEDLLAFCIEVVQQSSGKKTIDPDSLNTYKNKLSQQSKRLFNLITQQINKLINEPIG